MVSQHHSRLSKSWRNRFGLMGYGPPDLILSDDQIPANQYAPIVRTGFEQLHLDGFLCIGNMPTVAFLVMKERDEAKISSVHRALWNQGTARVLLVLLPSHVFAYSLLAPPIEKQPTAKDARLVQTFDLVASGLELAELISGIQSGRYFEEHADHFNVSTRVDSVLVDNLAATYADLSAAGLGAESAHALLMQVMFIAYLEDRGLLNHDYIPSAIGNPKIDSLLALLDSGDAFAFERLFKRLHNNFNSDIFIAPCAFGLGKRRPALRPKYLKLLADFRRGTVDFKTGQGRLWPYDFRYIPVELISAVYDRLLANTPDRKRQSGVYYTPPYLADFVVDQAWDAIPLERRTSPDFKVLDPACGSAIFLVRVFLRMVEDWRSLHEQVRPPWRTLVSMVQRLHGWDKQESAVRIGAFSLYIALLEQLPRAALGKLAEANKLLPPLFGNNLVARDFFAQGEISRRGFQLIIGNPPWVSRTQGATTTAMRWCAARNLPMPANELAWAFVWRALELSAYDGLTAFLLPAMGILLNLENRSVEARKRWLERVRLHRVVNLADTSFLLFEGAKRPTVLCLYSPAVSEGGNYTFEYWCPKASRFLGYARMLALTNADKMTLSVAKVKADPRAWSRYQWTASRDIKLLNWLDTLPKLGAKLATYRESLKRAFDRAAKPWIIGQGFKPAQPASIGKRGYHSARLPILKKLPYLPAAGLRALVIPNVSGNIDSDVVHRRGFVDGFSAPHVLIPQGVERRTGRLRAAYSEQDCCFEHSIQSIRFPPEDAVLLKLLTVVLNSKFAAWYLFHETGNLGADRAKVHEWELGQLPFPLPDELPRPNEARQAMQSILRLMDGLLEDKDDVLAFQETVHKELDDLVYAYYGLSPDEIAVIEDTVNYVIVSMQPRLAGQPPPLWMMSQREHWQSYVSTLCSAIARWLKPDFAVNADIVGASLDLVVLRVSLGQHNGPKDSGRQPNSELMQRALSRIHAALPRQVSRNLMLMPDLHVFLDDDLYLVKPRTMRYWLRSAALNDADSIAEEIFGRVINQKRRKLS